MVQGTVDDLYHQFFDAVLLSRSRAIRSALAKTSGASVVSAEMVKARLSELAQGQIFSGKEGLRQGLVDSLGDLDDAIDRAAALAHIPGKPTVITEKKKLSILSLFDDMSQMPTMLKPLQMYIGYRFL